MASTISYSLAPNPKWVFVDLYGRPMGAGSLYSYRSLDKTQLKFIYQDPAGNFPYTDPILIDANGTTGPLYFEFDSATPDDLYYLEVYDSQGVLQWTIDNFSGAGGGGGGGNITTVNNIENLVINNVFWRNSGSTANPIANLVTKLAPGCHAGLADTAANAGPDILFLKNNLNATDQITFPFFTLGTQPLTGDVTPVQYLKYVCTNTPSGETQKCIQIPIISNVQNLTNQDVSETIWARCNSGTPSLTLQWRTFFGDGVGASPDVITPIQTFTLTSAWQKFTVTADTVPDVTGKTLGPCGNSGLFLQIQFPLGSACDIDLIKPSLYLGALVPAADFLLYDDIDGKLNVPRTGDVRPNYSVIAPLGFILLNDGTIGNASSNATTRANIDTFPLFNLLWNNTSNADLQLFNSTGTPISRGANAIADFDANNQLSLPKQLGRNIAGYGSGSGLTARTLGEVIGTETDTLAQNQLPASLNVSINCTTNVATGGNEASVGGSTPVPTTIINSGGGQPINNMQPTVFADFIIKL